MADNPYVNKVEYAGQTVMDITDTTAEEGDVLSGEVFYKANGARSTGSLSLSNYVTGPSSSTDAHVAAFDGTTGKAIKDSGYTIGKSVPSDAKFTDTTYSAATQSANGLMSSADKTKLDGVATGATANVGTITGITMNGASKGTSGVVDLGTVITAHQDISGKVTGPSSATNNAVAIFDGTGGKTIKDSGYTIGKSVPSDAVFTDNDTKNTAGSTDSSSKLFLIGATSQAANPQTYSHDTAYVGTDGCLYSGSAKVLTAHQDISGKVNKSGDTMTDNLTVQKATGTNIFVTGKSTTSGLEASLGIGAGGTNHGVYSNGYVDGNGFHSDAKWLVHRGSNNVVYVGGYSIAKSVPSNAVFTDTTYTFDGTYNASTNKAATVSTVTNAITACVKTITKNSVAITNGSASSPAMITIDLSSSIPSGKSIQNLMCCIKSGSTWYNLPSMSNDATKYTVIDTIGTNSFVIKNTQTGWGTCAVSCTVFIA